MEDGKEVTPGEAIAAVDAAVETAHNEAAENAANVIEAVIEHSAQEIDAAQEVAEQVIQAAMQTELGRRVASLEERLNTWQGDPQAMQSLLMLPQIVEAQASTILQLQNQLQELLQTLSSIPPNSAEPEILEAVTVEPQEQAPPSAEAENPAPQPKAKARRWI
jgi:hypothetical protein